MFDSFQVPAAVSHSSRKGLFGSTASRAEKADYTLSANSTKKFW